MSDLVVTVPKQLWVNWISEGDAVGEPASGEEWAFYLGGGRPTVVPGDRLYIVAWGRLRGYAPVTRVERTERGWSICRQAGAVACTIAESIVGFRGWRKRWWYRSTEQAFDDWETCGVPVSMLWALNDLRDERKLSPCRCGRSPTYLRGPLGNYLGCVTCGESVGPAEFPGELAWRWNHCQREVVGVIEQAPVTGGPRGGT
jgi:hypothetical protein